MCDVHSGGLLLVHHSSTRASRRDAREMSAKPFDYSKWDNIELSDDEDTHPGAQFIEKETLRRIKRESHANVERERVQAIEALKGELKAAKKAVKEGEIAVVDAVERGGASGANGDDDGQSDSGALKALRAELTSRVAAVRDIEGKIATLEHQKKFNAEEMCYVAAEKTLVGKECAPEGESERARTMSYETFSETYKADMDAIARDNASMTYGELGEWFRDGRLHLLHEHATGYLLLKALYLQMEKKSGEARTCARVAFACKSIGEFAEAGAKSARDAAGPFFARLDSNDDVAREYEKSFEDYFGKLRERAVTKLAEEAAAAKTTTAATGDAGGDEPTSLEEIPREDRLGPGGLDPVEVYDALPQPMRDAFDAGDVGALKKYVNALPLEEARAHMKAMVDSGLWVPTPGEDPGEALR